MTEEEQAKIDNEKRQQEKTQAYKRFAMTDDGKVIMKDLEEFCGFYRPSVSEQHPNSLQTHFNEGKRRVYLRIQGFLRKVETENG